MNELLSVVRRRLPLVLLCGLIAFAVPTVLAITSPDDYRATSRLFVATSAQDVTAANQGNLAAQSRARTYALMATGPELLVRAAQRSGVSITGAELAKRITVSAPPDTVLLDVAATAPSSQEAAELSDAVAQELVTLVQTAEKPLRGGQPSLGLLILQPADAGATKVPAFDPLTVGASTVVGLMIGGVLALLIPIRFRFFRRRRASGTSTTADAPSETPIAEPHGHSTATAPVLDPETINPVDDRYPEFDQDPFVSTFDAPDTHDEFRVTDSGRPADGVDEATRLTVTQMHHLDRSPRPAGGPGQPAGPADQRPPRNPSPDMRPGIEDGQPWSFRDRFPHNGSKPDDHGGRPERSGAHAR